MDCVFFAKFIHRIIRQKQIKFFSTNIYFNNFNKLTSLEVNKNFLSI